MRVPAEAIPDMITVDLSTLDVAESLHISAVTLPPGCKPTITTRDFTIVTLVPPVVVVETPAAAAATGKGGKAAKGKK
jgi:large subunit ribosomal protein L25